MSYSLGEGGNCGVLEGVEVCRREVDGAGGGLLGGVRIGEGRVGGVFRGVGVVAGELNVGGGGGVEEVEKR